jgi:hypothetical protein
MLQLDLALFAIVDSIQSSSLCCAAVLRLSTDSCESLTCTCCDPRSSLFFGRCQKRGKALISLKIFHYLCKYQQLAYIDSIDQCAINQQTYDAEITLHIHVYIVSHVTIIL